jgi:hypothetical protein
MAFSGDFLQGIPDEAQLLARGTFSPNIEPNERVWKWIRTI